MFILDSLFISGLRFVLDKVATTVDAELNDDTVLRDELLAAEMRREMGEISDAEFAGIEADLLARIREIKERREGGSGPIAFGRDAEALDSEIQVEATVSGDFHEPAAADSGSVVEGTLVESVPPEKLKKRVGTTPRVMRARGAATPRARRTSARSSRSTR
jgi:Gas vesicle protein G